MWDVSVGGHFTAGEGSLETAIKETSEELGLTCDESALQFVCTVATTSTGTTPAHGDFVCNEYKVRMAMYGWQCVMRVVRALWHLVTVSFGLCGNSTLDALSRLGYRKFAALNGW